MNREILRGIGRKILQEIAPVKKWPQTAIGTGASGDKTHQIDKIAEDIVISGLQDSGESLTIVSEEIGMKEIRGGGKLVLIDPIDGSRNAVSGIPFYSTSIAIADGNTVGDIELSYIVNLVNGDEFWAEKGKGAFLNGEAMKTQQDDTFSLVAYEAQSPGKDIPRIIPILSESRKTRCLGSTALDLAYLSNGSISIFANPSPSRSFDFAGGWLLVKEAGGVFTDMKGDPIDTCKLGLEKSTPLLVSGNPRLHERVLSLLKTSSR